MYRYVVQQDLEFSQHALLSVPSQMTAKFGICTVVSLNGTLIEIKMFTFTLECTHFIFNECPV